VRSIARTAKKGVTFYNPLKADDGYTLFCCMYAKDVWLIDMEGHIVNRWRVPYPPGLHGILLPNGNLLYAAQPKVAAEYGFPREFSGIGGLFLELDWDSNIVWKAEAPYQNHDFQVMHNDHIIYMSYHPKGIIPDEIAARVIGGRPGTELNGKIWGDVLFEMDRNGNTVWEWIAYKHLEPELDPMCPLENRDHWHFNSVWPCRDGSILVSPRNLNEILRIAYPSGEVIGRYGRGELAHQHDARELDNGNILVFDNGSHRHNQEPSYSRSVEIDPNTDKIVWQYKADPPSDFYTAITAGSERLPNGNTVICDSWHGRIFEVTVEGELVWEYASPFWYITSVLNRNSAMMFRAHRYSRDYPGLKGKDLNPARFPWENRIFGPDAFKKEFAPCIF